MTLLSWHDSAEEHIEPFMKFADGQKRRFTIVQGEPRIVPGSTQDGKSIDFFQWDVILHEDGGDKKKILSTASKGLIRQLLAQDKTKPLQGRTFEIKATGDGKLRRFEVTAID